jgi:hypothetical protein
MSQYQEPVPQAQSNTMAIISMIAGIVGVLSLLLSFCVPCTLLIAILAGAAGAIMGFVGKKQIEESGGAQTGRGLAIAGIITGLISGVGGLISLILTFIISGLIVGTGLLFPILEGGGY